jgi:hypothetical protein
MAENQSAASPGIGKPNLTEKYERLPEVDFSRHVLEGQESALRVLRVPPCGWSDLGTPRRVRETLRRLPPRDYAAAVSRRSAYVNLAAQNDRLQRQAWRRSAGSASADRASALDRSWWGASRACGVLGHVSSVWSARNYTLPE